METEQNGRERRRAVSSGGIVRVTNQPLPSLPKAQSTQQTTTVINVANAALSSIAALQSAQVNQLFATQYSQPAQRAIPATDLLPPTQSPPTDERLARSINDAYQRVYKGTKFPTGPQRTEFMNMAIELRKQGKSAYDIELAIADKLYIEQQGLDNTSDETLNKLVDKAFQSVYNRAPTSAERTEWMQKAKDLRAQKDDKGKPAKSAQQIGYDLVDQLALKSQGLDKTDDASLNRIIEDVFRKVLEGKRPPTSRERSVWLKFAQDLAKDARNTGQTIKYAIEDALRTSLNNA
jgi:hypothetical protein